MDGFAKEKGKYTTLEASSTAVGLPEGLMGNSEVGHLNIGAGRVVYQDVVRIGQYIHTRMPPYTRIYANIPADQAIKTGDFDKNQVLVDTFESVKKGNGRLHLAVCVLTTLS